jgi:hypothetical protein
VGEVYDADVFQSDCNVSDIVNFYVDRGQGIGVTVECLWRMDEECLNVRGVA